MASCLKSFLMPVTQCSGGGGVLSFKAYWRSKTSFPFMLETAFRCFWLSLPTRRDGCCWPLPFSPPIFLPSFPIPRTHTTRVIELEPPSELGCYGVPASAAPTPALCVRSSCSSWPSGLCLCMCGSLCLECGSFPLPPPTAVSLWLPLIHPRRAQLRCESSSREACRERAFSLLTALHVTPIRSTFCIALVCSSNSPQCETLRGRRRTGFNLAWCHRLTY